jgi:hypothetical protein
MEAEQERAEAEEAAAVLAEIAVQQAQAKANQVLGWASECKKQDDLECLHESIQLKLATRYAETKATEPAAQFASNLYDWIANGWAYEEVPFPKDMYECVNKHNQAWPRPGEQLVCLNAHPRDVAPTVHAVFVDLSGANVTGSSKSWPKNTDFFKEVRRLAIISKNQYPLANFIFCSHDPRLVTTWCTTVGVDETTGAFNNRLDVRIRMPDDRTVHVVVFAPNIQKLHDAVRKEKVAEVLRFWPELHIGDRWSDIRLEFHRDARGPHTHFMRVYCTNSIPRILFRLSTC